MMVVGLRLLAIVGALTVYRVGRCVEPLYRGSPRMLLEPVSFVVPPHVGTVVGQTAFAFLAIWLVESILIKKPFGLAWREALGTSLRTYSALTLFWVYTLYLVPGLPGIPMTGWWLILDAHRWVSTLAVMVVVYQKILVVNRHKPRLWAKPARFLGARSGAIAFFLIVLVTLVALTPKRRFVQPYDERWGTGDEPRYVRIAASLLHDGDADISNAAASLGKRAEPLGLLANLASWIPAAFRTLTEVPSAVFGAGPEGEARPLGGQVIQGRKGGTYYVYLPGFPFLLLPAMVLDSLVHPGSLPFMVLTCLLLGVALIYVMARLIEPFMESRTASYGLSAALGFTLPLFLHHFQVYPEVTAALCVSVMLWVLLAPRLRWSGTVAFAVVGLLLPWLHVKYLPVWGVSLVAWMWKWRRSGSARNLAIAGVGFPLLGLAALCLYTFHISGSLMPDALWVMNGYPRGASIVNRTTPAGLYHLFLGSWQGLLVYGPMFLLSAPGLFALRRRSGWAFGLTLMVAVPYILIAASHDLGGAGGWSPPSRYLVIVVPVLAVWIAAYLSGPGNRSHRWFVFLTAASASFWTGQGMLEERNFVYDRPAFLASGHVNPSPMLGSVLEPQPTARRLAYPLVLCAATGLFLLGDRRLTIAPPMTTTILLLSILWAAGAWSAWWSSPEEWITKVDLSGPVRVRPGRSEVLRVPECPAGKSRVRFEGAGEPQSIVVRGPGIERHLQVSSTGTVEIDLSVEPVARISREGQRKDRWIEIFHEEGEEPVIAEISCP